MTREEIIAKSKTLVTKVCLNCGKEFQIPSYYGKGIFCSRKCSDEYKKGENNIKCCVCGKFYHLKPYSVLKNKTNYFCCSKNCMAKLRSLIYKGDKNPNAGHDKKLYVIRNNGSKYYLIYLPNHPYCNKKGFYKHYRYIVEQNYQMFDSKYFNIIEGSYYLKPEVDVHHINEITTDDSIENLIPLTRSEHTSLHCNKKEIIRDTKTGRIIGVIKHGELLENHNDSDNQQPNLSSNTFEGSTTSNRVQTDSAEDGNVTTSAVPNNNVSDDIV